jgi:hypothetical protein
MTSTSAATYIEFYDGSRLVRGLFANADGSWTAMSFYKSKTFKTRAGASKWLAKVSSY